MLVFQIDLSSSGSDEVDCEPSEEQKQLSQYFEEMHQASLPLLFLIAGNKLLDKRNDPKLNEVLEKTIEDFENLMGKDLEERTYKIIRNIIEDSPINQPSCDIDTCVNEHRNAVNDLAAQADWDLFHKCAEDVCGYLLDMKEARPDNELLKKAHLSVSCASLVASTEAEYRNSIEYEGEALNNYLYAKERRASNQTVREAVLNMAHANMMDLKKT